MSSIDKYWFVENGKLKEGEKRYGKKIANNVGLFLHIEQLDCNLMENNGKNSKSWEGSIRSHFLEAPGSF